MATAKAKKTANLGEILVFDSESICAASCLLLLFSNQREKHLTLCFRMVSPQKKKLFFGFFDICFHDFVSFFPSLMCLGESSGATDTFEISNSDHVKRVSMSTDGKGTCRRGAPLDCIEP